METTNLLNNLCKRGRQKLNLGLLKVKTGLNMGKGVLKYMQCNAVGKEGGSFCSIQQDPDELSS